MEPSRNGAAYACRVVPRPPGHVPDGPLAGPGRLSGEEREDAAESLLELAPVDDEGDLTVLEQELRALEPFGQGLADRLGDHARAGEAHQRARPGEEDGAEHREARPDGPPRRIGPPRG